jgi:Concanavalin A-like lectin/glucanases superfamily
MASQWELICYHTYSGTPGVVYDLSPDHRSSGVAVNLADSDFIAAGATAGSGAVRFHSTGAAIWIPPNTAWRPLDAVRGEVTLLLDPPPAGGGQAVSRLIDAGSVQFDIRAGGLRAWFVSNPSGYTEVSTALHAVVPNVKVPTGQWTTVGFLHDGVANQQLFVDGVLVAATTGPLRPVAGSAGVTIGNAPSGGYPIRGLLDDVKVWRANPRRIFDEFFDRPMDPETAACWDDYLRRLRRWMDSNPDCADKLQAEVMAAANSVLRDALNHGPRLHQHLVDSAKRYRAHWRAGELDSPAMARLLGELASLLQAAGIAPDANPDVLSLGQSECLRRFRSDVGAPDCDRQFMAMLDGHHNRDQSAAR